MIDEILGTEKAAQRTLEQAREAASRLKTASDAEAAGVLAAAREAGQALLREATERARSEAAVAHRARAQAAESENRRFLEQQEPAVGRLVDEVVALILTPEHAKG